MKKVVAVQRLKQSLFIVLCVSMVLIMSPGCSRKDTAVQNEADSRLRVVTTLFPLYDFARTIAGDRARVTLLLPPGVEPHSFEPRPDDIVRIGKSGLFVFTSPVMEPWAAAIIKGGDRQTLRVVEAGAGVSYLNAATDDDHDHGGHQHSGNLDPHIWLDFGNDQLMTDNILAGFVAADPANADYYRGKAATLKQRLKHLDLQYRDGLTSCASRTLLHGGHYTFGYLARRYDLKYRSLSGVSSEAEPSAARMAGMVRDIRQSGARYLFAEELLSPRLSEILATEAGVAVLKLHGAHSLGRDDFQRGMTFFDLMEANLDNLKKGLACRGK